MKPLLGILLAGGALGVVRADRLVMDDDARLTGMVRSIDQAGAIELVSPLSPDLLTLNPKAVRKVEFSQPAAAGGMPGALIELSNGDILPADILGLDDTGLKVATPDAGNLNIPRSSLKSMQLGVRARKLIYTGPRNLEEWTKGQDLGKNWRFVNNGLEANGPARAAHAFDLPPRFILKFTLKWAANPNFQVYFADPLIPAGGKADRYYFQFNSGGIEVKREASNGKPYQSIILLSRTPDQFPENELHVELRVDRLASRLHLLLNGEPEAAGVDPFPEKPKGNGISIVSISAVGSNQEVRGIEIHEYDNSRSRHLSEERGDVKTDSLISREDERWGGRLTGVRKVENVNIFSFKSDFQEEPLEIPETDVSTLFFAKPETEAVPAVELNPFALKLRGEGSLRVSSCIFTETGVKARHPLLGDLEISRAGVSALERLETQPEVKTE